MNLSKSKFMTPALLIGLVFFLLPGCSRDGQEQESAAVTGPGAESPAAPPVTTITGEVLEVVETDGFIFIRLDRGKEQIWATVPAIDVKVGEEITLLDANAFRKFYSKSLDRTFDELVFSTGIEGKGADRSASFGRSMSGNIARQPAERRE